MPGRKVVHLVGADDELLAVIGADAHPPAEHDAAVVKPARRGSRGRARVLLPVPPGLQDVAAHNGLGKPDLVRIAQRVAYDRLGRAQVAHFNSTHRRSVPASPHFDNPGPG